MSITTHQHTRTQHNQDEYSSSSAVERFNSTRPEAVGEVIVQLIFEYLKKYGKLDGKNLGCLLDVACGNGKITKSMAKHFQHAIGVDSSAEQIALAVLHNDSEQVEFHCSPAEKLPLADHTVDVITSIFGLHYFDVKTFIPECRRILKQDGIALFYADKTFKIISTDNDDLPVIYDEVSAMNKKLCERAREISHPNANIVCDLHWAQFQEIDYKDKERIETKIVLETTLGEWGSHFLSVPAIQRLCSNPSENPVTELMHAVKILWSKEHLASSSINIKMVNHGVVIVLKN